MTVHTPCVSVAVIPSRVSIRYEFVELVILAFGAPPTQISAAGIALSLGKLQNLVAKTAAFIESFERVHKAFSVEIVPFLGANWWKRHRICVKLCEFKGFPSAFCGIA